MPVKVNPAILVLCHGGPIAEPQDAQYILAHTEGIAGFFGASSIERWSRNRRSKSNHAGLRPFSLGRRKLVGCQASTLPWVLIEPLG